MKKMPLVSVIIPTYNRLAYICKAIESVLVQTYKNYEIIVVDDGSTTNVKQVLEAYMNKIKYLYQENRGLAAARNKGVKNSCGKYLAFLDDDDLFEPRKLEIQVPILENNPNTGFVYSDCYEFDMDNPSELRLNLAVGRDKASSEFSKLFFINPNVRIPTVLIRRQCFKNVGLFDEDLAQHEDGDLLLRIALQWKVNFSNYPSARVRYHTDRMSQNRIQMNKAIIKSTKKILASYPEFKNSLGVNADNKLAEIYFRLGKAYLRKRMVKSSMIQFRSSRKLSKKYVNIPRICPLLFKIPFNVLYQRLRREVEIL